MAFIPQDLKRIGYDRTTKDFAAYYDNEVIGFYPTYLAAETALNAYVLDLIADDMAFTATELDAGDDPFNDGPSQDEQAAAAAAWVPCDGGWEQYTQHPFDPSKTVRLFLPHI